MCISSDPVIRNCIIRGNYAEYGGGIACWDSNAVISSCTIVDNNSAWSGGIDCWYSSAIINNCTLSGNTAVSYAGGLVSRFSSNPILKNCILWDDTPAEIHLDSGTVFITYSDVQGGWSGNNIDTDPNFFDVNNQVLNLRDYHLRPGSPCINAGDPCDTSDGQLDIDRDPRAVGGRVDMGSDEAICASAVDLDQGEEVILNPGGGGDDPNTEVLVVFENVSGPNDATVEITEVGTDLYGDGLFGALGRTLRIETSLADGQFSVTVLIPFDANALNVTDPFAIDLMSWDA